MGAFRRSLDLGFRPRSEVHPPICRCFLQRGGRVGAAGENQAIAPNIRQLGPADRERVLALWSEKTGGTTEPHGPERLLAQPGTLSIVAEEEGRIVGALLCGRVDEAYRHLIVVADSHRDTPLAQDLAGKGYGKLLASGATICRVNLSDPGAEPPFWQSLRWRPHERPPSA